MTTSQDIINSIFADQSSADVVDSIMDSISQRVYERIEDKKTEVFAKELDLISDEEEEEE